MKPNGEFASSQMKKKKKKIGERKCKACVSGPAAGPAAAGGGEGAGAAGAAPAAAAVDKSPEAFLKMAMESGGFLGACVSASKGESVKCSPEISAADGKELDHQVREDKPSSRLCLFVHLSLSSSSLSVAVSRSSLSLCLSLPTLSLFAFLPS